MRAHPYFFFFLVFSLGHKNKISCNGNAYNPGRCIPGILVLPSEGEGGVDSAKPNGIKWDVCSLEP